MIETVLFRLLGRDRAWRLGRRLYTHARGEKAANAIATNGEAALIGFVIAEAKQRSGTQATFWDIGANRRESSRAVLEQAESIGMDVSIDMFEPTPGFAVKLREDFVDRANVTIHPVALSDRDGTAKFAVVDEVGGVNSLELASVEPGTPTIAVSVHQGSAYAKGIGVERIDLIKIDTEGHDFSVLLGFGALFEQCAIGIAQFEYNSRWIAAHRALFDVFDFAERVGYRLGRVGPNGIELFDRWNPECDRFFEDNYALVAPDLVEREHFISQRNWSSSNTLR